MNTYLIKLALIMCVLVLVPLQAAEARGSSALYRNLISKHCNAVNHIKIKRFTDLRGYMSPAAIKIQEVQQLSGSWVRVYGVAHARPVGRTAHGSMDYNTRTGRVSCAEGRFTFSPYIPLWRMLTDD